MITILKGNSNIIIAAIPAAESYLVSLKNDLTHEVKQVVPVISSQDTRYTHLVIKESDNEDLANGRVSLNPTGFWSYVITSAGETVHSGKAKVIGAAYENSEYINQSDRSYVYVN